MRQMATVTRSTTIGMAVEVAVVRQSHSPEQELEEELRQRMRKSRSAHASAKHRFGT